MEWLDEQARAGRELLRVDDLVGFTFDGQRVPLIQVRRGIRKPANMSAVLSIRTSYTRPGDHRPYEDAEGPDGLLRYKYRGQDPQQAENRALRNALADESPLIWFFGATEGNYLPIYPVWIVGEEPEQLQFIVAFDLAQKLAKECGVKNETERRYVQRLTRQRVHQRVFRVQVLEAYGHRCAMCGLAYTALLDAAHILPDGHERGDPVVENGIALCKLHHAAYDEDLLGIRPDLTVDVRSDVATDTDGPVLLHAIQEMAGVRIRIPRSLRLRPDSTRLLERYERFRSLDLREGDRHTP